MFKGKYLSVSAAPIGRRRSITDRVKRTHIFVRIVVCITEATQNQTTPMHKTANNYKHEA